MNGERDSLYSDNTTCNNCGSTEWELPEFGGKLLSNPPWFQYFCSGCKKEQRFTHLHEKDGKKWHEIPSDHVIMLVSPERAEIAENPEKVKAILRQLSVDPTMDIETRRCDGCGKTVDEAYSAKTTFEGVEFVATVHDQSTGMKFLTKTNDGKKYVFDICSNGYLCRPRVQECKLMVLVAEKSEYDRNDREIVEIAKTQGIF
jgi:hypothetical protein